MNTVLVNSIPLCLPVAITFSVKDFHFTLPFVCVIFMMTYMLSDSMMIIFQILKLFLVGFLFIEFYEFFILDRILYQI